MSPSPSPSLSLPSRPLPSRPTVCVVTPSYNQGRFIGRTIDSVLSQNIPGLDYVVMDGGSTDETRDVLAGYGDRIRWVSERDRGQTDAVNKGLRATGGDIIGWLNSDDVYTPGALTRVLAVFESEPDVDIVYGDACHIDEDDAIINRYPCEPWNFQRLTETCILCQPAVFFRRQVVERMGPLDERLDLCMDYEYWLRLGKGGCRFRYLEGEVLAGSRFYAGTKTTAQRLHVHLEINAMMRRMLGRVPDSWLLNYAHTCARVAGTPEPSSRFVFKVALLSLWASLRWNHKVSPELRRLATTWVRGSLSAALHNRISVR
jgi:glycosyltransferase involved in cell wall biosynthesis